MGDAAGDDGITVWLNGHYMGGWPYGYASWRVDLTPGIQFGGDNVIAIRLDNPKNSSRWYPGGGIYRNVWLVKTAPVHVAHWGVYVTTPRVEAGSATVKLKECAPVKKVLLLVLVGAGIFAVWRKVQADRAELDLWTEATTDDD